MSKRLKQLNNEEMKSRLRHQRTSNELIYFLRECQKTTGYYSKLNELKNSNTNMGLGSSLESTSFSSPSKRPLTSAIKFRSTSYSSSSSSSNSSSIIDRNPPHPPPPHVSRSIDSEENKLTSSLFLDEPLHTPINSASSNGSSVTNNCHQSKTTTTTSTSRSSNSSVFSSNSSESLAAESTTTITTTTTSKEPPPTQPQPRIRIQSRPTTTVLIRPQTAQLTAQSSPSSSRLFTKVTPTSKLLLKNKNSK